MEDIIQLENFIDEEYELGAADDMVDSLNKLGPISTHLPQRITIFGNGIDLPKNLYIDYRG